MIDRKLKKVALCGLLLATVAGCGNSDGAGTNEATGGGGTQGTGTGAAGGGGASGGGAGDAGYAALIRGTLASSDLTRAEATYDPIARSGEAAAKAAGNFAHTVLLGTTLLDSTKNEFLAIDRWNNAQNMKAFYADPKIAEAFSSLFAAPPSIEYFRYQPAWVSWGDMNSGEAYHPYYIHLALGELSATDPAEAEAEHNQVASAGRQPSLDAGNVAHIVYLGLDDQRQFLGVDIWKSADNIESFYTNPQFVQAFGALFQSVSQPVYESTDWYQW